MGNEACGGAWSLSGPSIEDQNLDVTVELAPIDQLMGRRQFGLERGVDVTGVHMVTSHDDVHKMARRATSRTTSEPKDTYWWSPVS